MPCRILRVLYLRANGEIPCDDDFGEQVVLGWIPKQHRDFDISKLFRNEKYLAIEDAFASNTMPWGRICAKCAFNRPTDPPNNHITAKHISYFQVEPTLACALGCPGCSRSSQIVSRPGPHMLDLSRLKVLVDGLVQGGYFVHFIDYCGQGEPLDHRDFSAVFRITREGYPTAKQRLITNGNHTYSEKLSDVSLDEILTSVDGSHQDAYQQYRVGGDFQQTIRFMHDAKKDRADTKVVWKYILFAHNDSVADISLAENIAESIGVDELRFVRTHSAGRSSRWDTTALPLRWKNSTDSATPRHENVRAASA